MSGFSVDWLNLREPADHAARHAGLARAVLEQACEIVDLGCGTGANLRYLAEQARAVRQWTAVDHDPGLLAALGKRTAGITPLRTLELDLALRRAEVWRHVGTGPELLVTASALLDLVSESWLAELSRECGARNAAVLFALNYAGVVRCSPELPADVEMLELVNRHQLGDKGFAPALGPGATEAAARHFAAAGYTVRIEASDWQLGPEHAALQRALIEGWAEAAIEIVQGESGRQDRVRAWLGERLALVAAGQSRVQVGHYDVAAWRVG